MTWNGPKALVGVALAAFAAFLLVGDPYDTTDHPGNEASGFLFRSLWSSDPAGGSPSALGSGTLGGGSDEGRLAGRGGSERSGAGAAAGSKKTAARSGQGAHAPGSPAGGDDGPTDALTEPGGGDSTAEILLPQSPGELPGLGTASIARDDLRADAGASGEPTHGGRGDESTARGDDKSADPSDCGSPRFTFALLDKSVNGDVVAYFEDIAEGEAVAEYGKRFKVGKNPAFAFYFPNDREGHAGMLVGDRFYVEVHGNCISGPQVLVDKLST